MEIKRFNLLDEPWIKVITQDCIAKEVSLSDALFNAHEYRDLAGEMPTQDIAVLRLLIAIVHTVFSRKSIDGYDEPIRNEEDALDRWKEIMSNGAFPDKPLKEYLNQWHERFWLFHSERPFYQIPDAATGTENTAAKLNGEVSESNNKVRLFSMISGDSKRKMSYAEAARWLLFMNGFDDCAAKQRDKSDGSRSTTVGWLGKLGLITAVGANLFETLMLNMTMLQNGEELWPEEDIPAWELETPHTRERQEIPLPQNLAEILTVQSRRILLKRDGDRVVGYGILGGDRFDERNALSEPMTLWKRIENKKEQTSWLAPRQHARSRQVWRDFGAIVDISDYEKRPGVVSWCGILRKRRILDKKREITFRIACVRYDSSQSSSITDSFSDSLSFHADLLIEAGREWRTEIIKEIDRIEQASRHVGNFAWNLGKAAGQDEKVLKVLSETAEEQYYLSVDMSFRDWLLKLKPEQNQDERNDLLVCWESQARSIAYTLGKEMVEEKGDTVFVGRKMNDRHYSSPEAYKWFKYNINEVYPKVMEGDGSNVE